MKYEDFAKDNEIEQVGEPISIEIKAWKEEGDYLIGELIEIKAFEGSNFDTECKQYTFKTDNGLVSCILGGSMDKLISPKEHLNRVLHIKYKGKLDLDDGKRCNKFQIFDVTDAFNKVSQLSKDIDE